MLCVLHRRKFYFSVWELFKVLFKDHFTHKQFQILRSNSRAYKTQSIFLGETLILNSIFT